MKAKTIKNNIINFKFCKEVLFEHGCANRDDNNGHNEDAEKLKKK